MKIKDNYLLKSNSEWKNKKTWQPLMISIVLVLCVAIVHKTYWVTTTETNPEDIWANKQLTKDGNNWTITFQENAGDSVTFKEFYELLQSLKSLEMIPLFLESFLRVRLWSIQKIYTVKPCLMLVA